MACYFSKKVWREKRPKRECMYWGPKLTGVPVLMKSCADAGNELMCFSFSSGPVWRDLFNCRIKAWPTSVWEKQARGSNSLWMLLPPASAAIPFLNLQLSWLRSTCLLKHSSGTVLTMSPERGRGLEPQAKAFYSFSHTFGAVLMHFFNGRSAGLKNFSTLRVFSARDFTPQLLLRICLCM